jgi:hypothetical protein
VLHRGPSTEAVEQVTAMVYNASAAAFRQAWREAQRVRVPDIPGGWSAVRRRCVLVASECHDDRLPAGRALRDGGQRMPRRPVCAPGEPCVLISGVWS